MGRKARGDVAKYGAQGSTTEALTTDHRNTESRYWIAIMNTTAADPVLATEPAALRAWVEGRVGGGVSVFR